jgi:hypothetical protein
VSESRGHPSPDRETIDALGKGDLILQVDALRSDYDPCKLGPSLLPLVTGRLEEARAAHAAAALVWGTASQRVAEARKQLAVLLRDGFTSVEAIPEEMAPVADVGQALDTYGWERGKIGDLGSPTRIEILVRTAVQVTPHLPPYLRYPTHVLTRMITWLGVLDANKTLATGGTMETVRRHRDQKRDLLIKAISRVRHHYCTASDDREMNPELARIGMPAPTDGAPALPLPEAPEDLSYQSQTGEITVPALPAGAQLLVAWRQPIGGAPEVAGVSIEPAVGGSNFSPLRPGTAYEFWVTGRNAAGDGPASRHVSFTP